MKNVDELELDKFSQLAHKWWDKSSEFKPLHDINPLRLAYIQRFVSMGGKAVLDVGCGGGILSEGLVSLGAKVKGIDLAVRSVKVAQLHALESNIHIDYECVSTETLAERLPGEFDVVTCMEMLEHVPDPLSVVKSCTTLVKEGGWVFFSTLNRHPKAYLLAVLGAEYLLNMLPKGTHDYARFLKPSELAKMAEASGLTVVDITGMTYQPFKKVYSLSADTDVNYFMATRKFT